VKQPEDFDRPEELNEQGESFAELEEYLTHALRRVDAPVGFVERTMARAEASGAPRGKLLRMPTRLRVWTSGAIAAALVAGVFIGEQAHARRQRERAEFAQRQFEAAMRITGETLERTRLQLQQAGVPIGD
jgi:coproporphyrinogen III oxidase